MAVWSLSGAFGIPQEKLVISLWFVAKKVFRSKMCGLKNKYLLCSARVLAPCNMINPVSD